MIKEAKVEKKFKIYFDASKEEEISKNSSNFVNFIKKYIKPNSIVFHNYLIL